jgi:hypothetical protein
VTASPPTLRSGQNRVTQPPFIAGPLAQIVFGVIGLAPPSIGFIMIFIFCVIWSGFLPATAPLTNDFNSHISHTMTNLSAGQIVTIPANLLVLTIIFEMTIWILNILFFSLVLPNKKVNLTVYKMEINKIKQTINS